MDFSSWKTERRANTVRPASFLYKLSVKALGNINGSQIAFWELLYVHRHSVLQVLDLSVNSSTFISIQKNRILA